MIEVICYKNKALPIGFVANSYEADLVFTGLVVDNGSEKKSLKYPFDFALYGTDDLVIKDDFGKSYRIDATDTIYGTRPKLIAHINMCLETDYYEYFPMTGQDFIEVDYDLTVAATSTLESVRASVAVYEGGGKILAKTGPIGPDDYSLFTIESPNIIRFNEEKYGYFEVYIRNMFYPV